MFPRQIVAELDKHIVGQNDAKRAVAVALSEHTHQNITTVCPAPWR